MSIRSPWVATSAEYTPDRYYRYQDLTDLLHAWAEANPQLVAIESIGTSYEGRKIWVWQRRCDHQGA